jgi:hypothetical protein
MTAGGDWSRLNGLGVSGRRSLTWLADHAGDRVSVVVCLAHDLESSLRVEVDVRLRTGLETARHPARVRVGCADLQERRPLALAFGSRTDRDEVLLPKEVAESPDLAKGITVATLPIEDGGSITIRLPRAGHLIDDRHYNGSAYLLAFYPIGGEIPEGREWSYSVEIVHNREQPERSTDE